MMRRSGSGGRSDDPYGAAYQDRLAGAGGVFDPADDPRALRGVEVGLSDVDGESVNDEASARAAMSQALGLAYRGGLERLGDGDWLVDLPGEDADDLIESGFWGRENEDGYSVEAEWPSGGDDPRLEASDEAFRRELAAENEAEFSGEAELEHGFAEAGRQLAGGGNFGTPGRLTNQEVAQALAPVEPAWVQGLLAETESGGWSGVGPFTLIYRRRGKAVAMRFPTPGLRSAYLRDMHVGSDEILLHHDPRSGIPQPREGAVR
jgi:hypothetical protein